MNSHRMKRSHLKIIICLLLALATIFVYWQVQYFEFIDCDDTLYITENRHTQSGITFKTLVWAFTTIEAANWHPLTWLSLMLDYKLYGLNAGGYHWTNLIFHIANTLLLFLIVNRLTDEVWKSAFVAALFAVHPLNVESVAWVSERKNVLSMFFWIMTIWAYVFYVKRPGLRRYLLVLLTFALGLMAKPMLVTLPSILLLLDYWPLRRFSLSEFGHGYNMSIQGHEKHDPKTSAAFKLILEKIPLFVLSTLSSVITVVAAKHGGAVKSFDMFPLENRFVNILVSYAGYLEKMVWPSNLTIFYPYQSHVSVWKIVGAGFLMSGIMAAAVWAAKRYRYLPVGWLWYINTLLPVIGLVQVGYHSMADRYAYASLIGVFIMFAWGVPDFFSKWRHCKTVLTITACSIIFSLMICSLSQVKYWQNSFSVFQRALDVTENNHMAHGGMGNFYLGQGDLAKAADHYLEALRIRPDYADIKINLGTVYIKQGKYEEAIHQFQEALKEKPNAAKAYNNMGIVLALQGKIDDAITQFRLALTIDPENVNAKNNLSITVDRKLKSGS
jgi:predicted negative regulator of RcsB-dependent stress response